MAVVVKERTCRECGATFLGGPRAWYCPNCRVQRRLEAEQRYRAKGRKADRPLGSTDHCIRCGAEYIVNAARQKYCPDCAYDGIREADRPMSRAWNQAHKEEYYPARNAKRRKERAENPEPIREKERQQRRNRKLKRKDAAK